MPDTLRAKSGYVIDRLVLVIFHGGHTGRGNSSMHAGRVGAVRTLGVGVPQGGIWGGSYSSEERG